MTNEEARRWLDKEWQQVLAEKNQPPDPEIDQFVNSSIVSIRYACMTQLLGKIADPSRHILSIQASDTRVGSWDARSFAKHVIVPWVADNHAVLGTSTEPYVSKPLRRSALGDVSNVRDKAAWEAFILFLGNYVFNLARLLAAVGRVSRTGVTRHRRPLSDYAPLIRPTFFCSGRILCGQGGAP